METQRTTLSFLTESKASAVGFSSMRRVVMTLLVMLLLTATGAWAQDGPAIPTPKISIQINEVWGKVSAPEQAQMGTNVQFTVTPYNGYKIKSVSLSDPGIYDLAGSLQTGIYLFTIGASDVTITVVFEESEEIEENKSLKYVITDEDKRQVEVSGYEGEQPTGVLKIPATTIINDISYSVTSIGKDAFSDCGNLLSVIIPNGVTSIGNYAFYNCNRLQSATLPNSVTSIGYGAFASSSLTSITIPNSMTSIGYGAFLNCGKLTSITLNSNPKIGEDAFYDTPATVTMNLTASNVNEDKWTTFYNNGYNFQSDENTKVYKGTVEGSSLVLTEVEDKIVNRGTAVILKSSGNPVMTLTESSSSDTNGNDLRGISDRTLRTDVIANITDANAIYTMGNTSAGFGFHKYTGEYVPAGKAFLPLNTSNGAKAILTMVFADMTTGVNELQVSNDKLPVYDLNGRKVSENNLKPGIYVSGNKKVVVR